MKLHVFGAAGSGVTTLGEALSKKMGIPYFDSDDYFWLKTNPPFTQRLKPTDRNQLLLKDLKQTESWILGGSIINWGELLFPNFDLVVFLYLPKEIRMDRVRTREWERYGEVIFRDPKRQAQYQKFIDWAADYDDATGIAGRTLKAHQLWLKEITAPVLEIIGDLRVEDRVKLVIDKLTSEIDESS